MQSNPNNRANVTGSDNFEPTDYQISEKSNKNKKESQQNYQNVNDFMMNDNMMEEPHDDF